MKKLLLTMVLALPVLASGAKAAPKKAAHAGGKVQWHSTFASGLAEAKKTGKPMFVDFYTTWCGPCKYLEDVTYKDAKFVAESKNWVMVKLDAEKGPDNTKLAQKFKISAFPSMLCLESSGKETERIVGGYPAKLLIPKMRKAADKAGGGVRA